MSEEVMMNATPIDQLPSPPLQLQESAKPTAETSYQEILQNLQKARQIETPPSTSAVVPPQPATSKPKVGQYQELSSKIQKAKQVVVNSQQIQPTASMIMQTPIHTHTSNKNVMQELQSQASVFDQPQNSDYTKNILSTQIHQGPLKSELLPDPMFFQNPPQPRKIKKVYIEKEPPKPPTFLGFDQNKLKRAVLVAAIVYLLISYVAPLMAKSIQWSVNQESGKFTAAGLLLISTLTGGLYLGFASIIDKFGNGVSS